jgi:hypothetical protein
MKFRKTKVEKMGHPQKSVYVLVGFYPNRTLKRYMKNVKSLPLLGVINK